MNLTYPRSKNLYTLTAADFERWRKFFNLCGISKSSNEWVWIRQNASAFTFYIDCFFESDAKVPYTEIHNLMARYGIHWGQLVRQDETFDNFFTLFSNYLWGKKIEPQAVVPTNVEPSPKLDEIINFYV